MTEQQENILIARLIEFREGSYNPTAMIRIIKSILSPLPHQDGASAEDVLEPFLEYNHSVSASMDLFWLSEKDAIKAMHQFAQSETAKVVAEKDREIVSLESALSESMEVKVSRVLAEAGKYEMDLEHPMFIAFIDTIIGIFKAAGAMNYYAMKCVSNHEMYDFIIQRSEGKTPADIVGELRTELSTANARIAELERQISLFK